MASEFDIIRRYFEHHSDSVKLGVGDDCALIDIGDGKDLVITTDTLVGGTHFLLTLLHAQTPKPGQKGESNEG